MVKHILASKETQLEWFLKVRDDDGVLCLCAGNPGWNPLIIAMVDDQGRLTLAENVPIAGILQGDDGCIIVRTDPDNEKGLHYGT